MFATVRAFHKLVRLGMLLEGQEAGATALYPGQLDPDATIPADQAIMQEEVEDKMETPPPGYQGQITLTDPQYGTSVKVLYGGPGYVPHIPKKEEHLDAALN